MVAVALGLVKKQRSVAVVGSGSNARLFWQWLKQAHEVQRLLATRRDKPKSELSAVTRHRSRILSSRSSARGLVSAAATVVRE